jgi:hypothetical protein
MLGTVPNMSSKRGRPAGLLLNPDAARHALAGRPQLWLAVEGEVSPGHLSAMFAGTKACTPEVAERLSAALGCPIGMLFPEVVQFTTTVRHFTAPKVEAA